MSNEVTEYSMHAETVQKVLLDGDLATLKPDEKVRYYQRVCESLGLNPLTKPFEFIKLNNKLVMYARRECTEQLAQIHGVSFPDPPITKLENGVYTYMVKVVNKDGRVVYATGAVGVDGLKGEALANALLRAETKAHRRGTLKICGLGMLDETEVESVQQVERSKGKVSLEERVALLSQTVKAAEPMPVQAVALAVETDVSQAELNDIFPPEGTIEAEDIANGLTDMPAVPGLYDDDMAWSQVIRDMWKECKRSTKRTELFYRLKNEYAQYLPEGTRLLEALPLNMREPFVHCYQQRMNELGHQA